jgi:predicted amidohydrolase YtcJ
MSRWVLAPVRVWAGPGRGESGSAVAFDTDTGKVVARGDVAAVRAAAGEDAATVDGRGRWLVPGFVDAHLHVIAAAVAAEGDCSHVAGPGELLARVAEAARRTRGWVSLHGLEHRQAGGATLELPPPSALEEASGGRPVRIRHRTLHAWYLGPRAAAALRVGAGWLDDPTGELARAMPPARGEAELELAVAAFSRRLLDAGVTALQDAGAGNGEVDVERLLRWESRGLLLQEVSVLTAAPCRGAAGRKLLPPPGASADELAQRLSEAAAGGAPVAVHCADLETLGAVLEAAERLGGSFRLRIEHASVCPPEWIPRLAALGATVVTQPAFILGQGARYLDDPAGGPEPWLYRLGSWLRAGVGLAFGSDAPAGPIAPLEAVRAAVERRLPDGRCFGAAEALTPAEALAAAGAWAADACGLRGWGRLDAGGPGSAVLLEGEPWSIAGALGVRAVIHRGRLVA